MLPDFLSDMELNDDTGESAPRDPKLAGAQHNESKVCQPSHGTTRPGAQPAPVWDNVDSDVALRRGIGYLHARDDFQAESLPATSCKLVDRQASDPSPHATATRGFWSDDDLDKTIEVMRPDMESGQLNCSDSQRRSAQFLPADAVISTVMRLTTRDLYLKRTAGPYPPDSHCQIGLLEGGSAIHGAQRGALTDVDNVAADRPYRDKERSAHEKSHVDRHVCQRGAGFDYVARDRLDDFDEKTARNDVERMDANILGAQWRGASIDVDTVAANRLYEHDNRRAHVETIERPGAAILGFQARGASTDVDSVATTTVTTVPDMNERNDVGLAGFGFDEMRTATRNDVVATRDQRQHEARNAADDVTSTPYRHAEKRECDRHDGYATGFLIDEKDERRCSDQPTHACRQSDWTGYAQQSAMCNSLKATAVSNAYAVDARHRTGFDNTLDATRRVMTTCVTDADMDDYQSGTACAIVYEPATDCENRLHRRCAFDTSIHNDSEADDVGLKRQFTPTERHSLDGGPRRGRSSLPSQAAPLRPMLVYLDPQTGLLSPMRHDCRMTLNNYEKVIDTQANATRLKRAKRAAKRLSFFDDRKPGLPGTEPINAELPHEPRPSACLNRSTGPNDYHVGQHAVRDKDTRTVKKPAPEHNLPAKKTSCRASPGCRCDGMLDQMPVPTSVRLHDVTSPKRRSADARITDLKVSCDCQQHACGKTRARNDRRSVDNDQEAASDYAHCDKGKYKSASGRRHRHRSDSSPSESSSSSESDCAAGEKQLPQSPGRRQSRLASPSLPAGT